MNDTNRKFEGFIGWSKDDENEEEPITRAILRADNELVIECHYEDCRYTVLRISKNQFSGKFQGIQRGDTWYGKVSCNLKFKGNKGRADGKWIEETYVYDWWADLVEIDHFKDEQIKKRPKKHRPKPQSKIRRLLNYLLRRN